MIVFAKILSYIMEGTKINERVFTGHLVNWINEAIKEGKSAFEYVTNDEGVKLDSGKTLFPDILLFTNKISGEVFNGWELKDPQTDVDDKEMLINALLKAERLHSNSFVTWNCKDAIIWKIEDDNYTLEGLSKLKVYPTSKNITTKDDIKVFSKYIQHEKELRERAFDILHDLDELYRNGTLRPAIDVSSTIIDAIRNAYKRIVPQFTEAIKEMNASNKAFRKEYKKWTIYESATLKVLESSSRSATNVVPEQILATLTFYNLVGKIIFYYNLCENLPGELDEIFLENSEDVKTHLNAYFDRAKAIDYHAIFQPYFTDGIEFSTVTNNALFYMISAFAQFDFRNLPTGVMGHILENLVPAEEKQKFGQYYTGETLANFVAFPAVQTKNDVMFDPTSGTGTFLISFYNILKSFDQRQTHSELLNHIWGNDVSHFPAILSVINLYKQDVGSVDNFPRIMRNDFFNLEVGDAIEFPDPQDFHKHRIVNIPLFDGIASNFPFIQQEDNPSEIMIPFFKGKFELSQQAFLNDDKFEINERSDYFTYCVYNSYRFLKDGGILSAITSNAWLGKEYGIQFKKFLINNFHIKYIVRSKAEHWFKDSQVSTIFFVLEKIISDEPTKFVTLNFKLEDFFDSENVQNQIKQIDKLYTSIDYCCDPHVTEWTNDKNFKDLYRRNDGLMDVCVIPQSVLMQSIDSKSNWSQFFISAHIFDLFERCLVDYSKELFTPFRGERTGWDPMFMIPAYNEQETRIASSYLVPCVKSSTELSSIKFNGEFKFKLFVCSDNQDSIDSGTNSWINKFKNQLNKNKTQTIPQACSGHNPYWYSLNPKRADIVTSINPYERYFFSYSKTPITIGQRLIALKVNKKYDVEFMAALLNSVVVFLEIELKGTNRNLGVLDLNANYIKQLRFLNPDLISGKAKADIIDKFKVISNREILPIEEEVKREDRRKFDQAIFTAFGLPISMLSDIYELLVNSVRERVTMRDN